MSVIQINLTKKYKYIFRYCQKLYAQKKIKTQDTLVSITRIETFIGTYQQNLQKSVQPRLENV